MNQVSSSEVVGAGVGAVLFGIPGAIIGAFVGDKGPVDTPQDAQVRALGIDPATDQFMSPGYAATAEQLGLGTDPAQIAADARAGVTSEIATDTQTFLNDPNNQPWYKNVPWQTLLILLIVVLVIGGIREVKSL